MKKTLFWCSCLIILPLYADVTSAWSYGTAASYAQKGNWTDAQKQLNQLLVNAPDRADILYDSGVAAYRLGEFEKATAYFEQISTIPDVEKDLKKQAHFNLGNTKVAQNQLPDAISQYETVLTLDPDNEPARHNLEKVKEMLRQQQQQQQQQQKDNNQQDKNNKQDEQKNDQNQNQQESQNQDSSESSEQNKQESNNQGSNKQQNKSNEKQDRSNQGEQQQSMNGDQKEKDEANNQQERNEQNNSNHKPNQQDRNNKQNKLNNSHTFASDPYKEQQEQKQQPKNASHPTKNEHKEQAMQTGVASDMRQEDMRNLEQELASHERWMARVLAHQEKADQKAQKTLIKANINKQLAGNDGQNCW